MDDDGDTSGIELVALDGETLRQPGGRLPLDSREVHRSLLDVTPSGENPGHAPSTTWSFPTIGPKLRLPVHLLDGPAEVSLDLAV